MSIAQPIDVTTPATQRRQALAQKLQQQYSLQRGTQRQAQALNAQALHAMPLFAGAGARDSLTLPSAPLPQLTVPYMQNPGVMRGLGVVNPAQPQNPNVSQAPGVAAPGMNQNLGVVSSADPNAPNSGQDPGVTGQVPQGLPAPQAGPVPQAGDGTYANGAQAPQPIFNQDAIFRVMSGAAPRRLVSNGFDQQTILPFTPLRNSSLGIT